MIHDPASDPSVLRRADGSIDTGVYLDRARDRRNACLAGWLRAAFARPRAARSAEDRAPRPGSGIRSGA